MIPKELARKLDKAGFPDITIDEYFEHRVGSHSDDYGGESDYPCYCNKDKFPTLSELIEACGKNFAGLSRTLKNEYCAVGESGDIAMYSKTPEEAIKNENK